MINLTFYSNKAVLQLLKGNKEFNTVVMNAENIDEIKKHLAENYLLNNSQFKFITNSIQL